MPSGPGFPKDYDFLIVGAGYAGATLARCLADTNQYKILVIDRYNHIAGHAYDYKNSEGITVHKYGPHIFHTSNPRVWEFLSRFTQWHPYEHRVLAKVEDKYFPIPINVDTVNRLYGTDYTAANIQDYYNNVRLQRPVENGEDAVISKVGVDLYEKFFKNYTKKQWDLWPHELEASVLERIPVRTNHDDRYFTDTYQAIPAQGYTKMFEKILDHPAITVELGVDLKDVSQKVNYSKLIYTGCIDEFFDFKYGPLPYRSLRFEFETLPQAQFQPVAQVNYPGAEPFTRIVEYKHFLNEKTPNTVIVKEFSTSEGDPYYPIPRKANIAVYNMYKNEAAQVPNVYFVGRLAQYKYLNMDKVVESALELFDTLQAIPAEKLAEAKA